MAAVCRPIGGIQRLFVRSQCSKPVCLQASRFKYTPPDPDDEILPSWSQRLAEWKSLNVIPRPSYGINIGLPFTSSTNKRTHLQKLQAWTKKKVYIGECFSSQK